MLSSPSQLLIRNKELFSDGSWLLANSEDSEIFDNLGTSEVSGFHQYFDVYQQCQVNTPDKHLFAAQLSPDKKYDGIVLYMPKAKAQAQMLLSNLACALKPGGVLMLVGENKGGIKGGKKLLGDFGPYANKIDSARHCSLFSVVIGDNIKPFILDDWLQTISVTITDHYFDICSLPGVFGHGQLDLGTRLLLETVDSIPSGKVLDFGCGAGVIGTYLGLVNSDAEIVMTDVSALALYSAQKTAQLNNVQAEFIASNGLSEIKGNYQGVFTNPPFHTGIKTDYATTEGFIKELPRILSTGAQLKLVANSFLHYPPMMEEYIGETQILMQTSKFKVYLCQH